MQHPQDVEEFLSRLSETEDHLTVPLAGDEYARWDAPDDEARQAFRDEFAAECALEAEQEGADSVIIHSQLGAVLCIGQPYDQDNWEFLEFEGDKRVAMATLLEEG